MVEYQCQNFPSCIVFKYVQFIVCQLYFYKTMSNEYRFIQVFISSRVSFDKLVLFLISIIISSLIWVIQGMHLSFQIKLLWSSFGLISIATGVREYSLHNTIHWFCGDLLYKFSMCSVFFKLLKKKVYSQVLAAGLCRGPPNLTCCFSTLLKFVSLTNYWKRCSL